MNITEREYAGSVVFSECAIMFLGARQKKILFSQAYRKGVAKYYGRGVRIDESIKYSRRGYVVHRRDKR